MKIPKVPKEYLKVIRSIYSKAERNKVNIRFGIGKTVHYEENDIEGSQGYFTIKEIAVGTGIDFDIWILTLLHESCHMDQSFDRKIKDKVSEWDNSSMMYFEWLNGTRQLNKKQIKKYCKSLMECELDCDKRTVEKIKKFNLPINIKDYIRRSNIYISSYNVMSETRKWYNEICLNEEIYKKSSNSFIEIGSKKMKDLTDKIRQEVIS